MASQPPPPSQQDAKPKKKRVAKKRLAPDQFSIHPPKLPNPGKYDDLMKEASMISGHQELFEGYKLSYQRPISSKFALGHNFSLGGSDEEEQAGSYAFTTDFVEMPFVSHCRLGSTGKLFTHIAYDKKPFSIQFQAQVDDPESSGYSLELGHRSTSRQIQAKLSRGGVGFSFLQSVTKNLCIGADNFLVTNQAMTLSSFGGRYKWSDKSYTAVHITPAMLSGSIAYIHKPIPALSFASELSVTQSQRGMQTIGMFSVLFSGHFSQIKTSINSRGRLTSAITQDLGLPFPLLMNFSFDLDYLKKEYKLGYGLSLQL